MTHEQIDMDFEDEPFMDSPMFQNGEDFPMINTINNIQETVIENIYSFITEIWPFDMVETDETDSEWFT